MVTTDSYRLSIMEADLGVPLDDAEPKEAIIPARAMQEVGRIFSSSDEENIEMILSQNQALFRIGDIVFSTTLIEGKFPEYGKLIPEDFEREISISREDLIGTLRRVNLFTGRQSPQVPVSLSFSKGAVEVIVRSQEIGEARETLQADSEDEFYISFNPSYLMDGVSAIDTKNVVFRFNEPMKPGTILPENEDGEFLYLIMPMRDPHQG
jgi:DNA polymerase-3 subunit beta